MTQDSADFKALAIPKVLEERCREAWLLGHDTIYVSVPDYEKIASIHSHLMGEMLGIRDVAKTFYTEVRLQGIRILWRHGLPDIL